jgi:hypothetical protein
MTGAREISDMEPVRTAVCPQCGEAAMPSHPFSLTSSRHDWHGTNEVSQPQGRRHNGRIFSNTE